MASILTIPPEIRKEIFSYLVPHIPWKEETNRVECKVSKKDDPMSFSRARGSNRDDLRALQKSCTQLYHEVRPTWFKYNPVCLREESLAFSSTIEWFNHLPPMVSPLLSRIKIMVEPVERFVGSQTMWQNVLAWKHFEEGVLPKGILVRIIIRHSASLMQWIHCSSLLSKFRDAKMSWEEIGECIQNVDGIIRWREPQYSFSY